VARPSTSFQKRQRELAKAEARREKIARREQRKKEGASDGGGPPIEAIDPADLGLPGLESLTDTEADEKRKEKKEDD
jgi:hypothetical protein